MKLNDYKKVNDTGRLYRINDYHKWIQVDEDGNIVGFSTNVLLDDLYSDDWIELTHIAIGDIVLDDEVIGLVIDQVDNDTYYVLYENGCVTKANKYYMKKLESGNCLLSRIISELGYISEKYNSN